MKRIVCILAFFLVFLAQGQSKAEKLLNEVEKKITSYKTIALEFKYVLDNSKEGIRQEIKGNLKLQGQKYVLDYMGATKIFDGVKSYTIVPENEEVTIETPQKETEITPAAMLTFYKKGYSYKWDIEQKVQGKKIQYIALKPTDASSQVKQILLGIDMATKLIYNVIQVGKNDTKTTIVVTNFKPNAPLSNDEFKFNEAIYKQKGYYINKY